MLTIHRNQNNTASSKDGFSLIEMIVSIALFSIILVAALGSLLVVIDANRKAKAIKLVVNNLNLSIEGISRELRVGSEYCAGTVAGGPNGSCNTSLGSESDAIYFTTDRAEADSFFGQRDDAIVRRIDSTGPVLTLTGSDVVIDDLKFHIRNVGIETVDPKQPSVVIIINGHSTDTGERSDFFLQTTVSQRKLEL